MNRKQYFKEYRRKHKEKLISYSKKQYQQNKAAYLTYAKKYYILNRVNILAKFKKQRIEFVGHAHVIYKAVKKYAKAWKLPISEWDDFRTWAISDPTYDTLFKQWKDNAFDTNFCPVVMRGVKKNGFIVENLKWDIKKQYSWWSEDLKIYQQVGEDLDNQQKERNKRNAEWQRKTREEWEKKKKKA